MCLYMLWHPHTLLGEKKEHRTSKSLSSLFFFYSIDKLLLLFVVIEEERCKLGWTSAREKKRNEKRRILTICLTSHLLLSLSLPCFIIWVLRVYVHLHTHPPVDSPSLFYSHHGICSLIIKLKVNSIETKIKEEIFLFMINSLVCFFFFSCFFPHFYVLVDSLTAVKRIMRWEKKKEARLFYL